MKYLALRLAIALCTFIIGLSAAAIPNAFRSDTASEREAEQEVLQAEDEYIEAHLKQNAAALDSILADEFTIRSRYGRVTDKAQRLALLETAGFAFESIKTDGVEVKVDKDHATVTGEAVVQSRYGEREFISPQYRFTRQYEKRDGRWQVVSVRVTR
ncbi:MAG TPA: nuclear transport factor 2 family protein [Pyrinomonadaceae bacterium]|jgi:type II secretory pathway pseudopilin PulG